jgi:hypothetical protein
MYLKRIRRLKDGKEHFYWNIVESQRCAGCKIIQRQVLYLGEINGSQREAWCRVIDAFDEGSQRAQQLALFSAERAVPEHAKHHAVQVRLGAMQLHRPGNGAHVGWRALSMSSWRWTGSGLVSYPTPAKAPAGGTFCKRWCATG